MREHGKISIELTERVQVLTTPFSPNVTMPASRSNHATAMTCMTCSSLAISVRVLLLNILTVLSWPSQIHHQEHQQRNYTEPGRPLTCHCEEIAVGVVGYHPYPDIVVTFERQRMHPV